MACHAHLLLLLLLALPAAHLPSSSAAKLTCHPADKLAIRRFVRDIGDPYAHMKWSEDDDCCHWRWTKCDPSTGRLTVIAISFDQLAKPTPLPPSVGDLPFLETLIIRKSPNITGPLPEELAKLTKLRFLSMDWNGLTGSVPAFLSRLMKLNYINLSFNKLSGAIPPSLGDLPLLQALFLDRNQLTGPIPEELGRLQQPELYIRLSHNNLSGVIPSSFSLLNFSQIDLARNQLSGDASVLFSTSWIWTSMNLSRNLFQFDISKAASLKNIYSLDLSHNRIYGSIPAKLDKMERLSFLDVSYNRLCGQIPQGGFLSNLTQNAFLHNRCLCGSPLPKCK